ASYLSVPVQKKGKLGQPISAVHVAGDAWKTKHLKSIYFEYKNRPYFSAHFPRIERLIEDAGELLSDLNSNLIRHFCECLRITTPIVDSATLDVPGENNALLVN